MQRHSTPSTNQSTSNFTWRSNNKYSHEQHPKSMSSQRQIVKCHQIQLKKNIPKCRELGLFEITKHSRKGPCWFQPQRNWILPCRHTVVQRIRAVEVAHKSAHVPAATYNLQQGANDASERHDRLIAMIYRQYRLYFCTWCQPFWEWSAGHQ